MTTYKFKKYLFNIALNSVEVAVYESDIDYELKVEKDGELLPGYKTQTFFKNSIEDSLDFSVAELFLENEDDMHYNQARALKNVIEGMYVADIDFS